VLLLAVDSARERRPPPAARAWTVGTAVTGLLLVSLSGGGGDGSPHGTAGILLALGSGAAYALSAEAAGPLSRQHDSLATTTVTMGVAAVVLVPIGTVPVILNGGTAWTWDGWSWLLLAHLGIVTMALAYGMLFAGLRTTASGTAVVATLVEPVTALALAAVVLGEGLRATGVLGSVLVVAAIGSLGRRPAAQPPPQ
jgi:DME family drug/metabolite transporter